MTISAQIRKRYTGSLATAIHAISATQRKEKAATVAKIATVAVANTKEMKSERGWFATEKLAKISPSDKAPPSHWCLVRYCARNPLEAASYPEAIHADTRKRYAQANKGRTKR